MIVVSDTSILNYAVQIGCIALLQQLFGEVIIPTAVRNEMIAAGDEDLCSLLQQSWLRIQTPTNSMLVAELHIHIDLGESEAIALAVELATDFLLIDDGRGRKYALKHGLNITGLLGVFLLAKKAGIVPRIYPLIEHLLNETDFRADNTLVKKILVLAGEASRS